MRRQSLSFTGTFPAARVTPRSAHRPRHASLARTSARAPWRPAETGTPSDIAWQDGGRQVYLNGAAQSGVNLFTDDRAGSHVSTMLRVSALAALLVLAISFQGASAQSKPNLCYLPPRTGLCLAYFPSFYYDSSSGTCRSFVYGGCQGNENRFVSYEECISACG